MKKTTGNKVQSISIGDIKGTELLVNFDWEIIKYPSREEYCHGVYSFNEDEENITINSVALVICGIEEWRKKANELNAKQLSAIEDVLSVE